MKKTLSLVIILMILFYPLFGRRYIRRKRPVKYFRYGVGAIIGEPTGISLKMWTSRSTAVDAAIAYSIFSRNIYLHTNYLIQANNVFHSRDVLIPLYFGFGGRIILSNNSRIGIKGALGIEFIPYKAPFDIFMEIAPYMDLIPATGFGINGGIGMRFIF
jgi:hypothetical protein